MRRLLGVCLAMVAGCGNPPDMGGQDMGAADFAGSDGSGDDLALTLSGTKVVGGNLTLMGATDDDHLVFADNAMGTVQVVAADGSGKMSIAPDGNVGITHNVVFVWHNVDSNDNGDLAVWAAGKVANVSTGTAAGGFAEASADSGTIAWIDNLANDFGDLVAAKADGTGKVTLKAGVEATFPCAPQLQFAGARLIASYCVANTPRVVTSFDPVNGSGVDLLADAAGRFSVDAAGKNVFVVSAADVGTIVAASGGNPLVADVMGANFGLFTSDGSAVVFHTATMGIARVTTGGMVTPLQASGAEGLDALSPDGKWMLFHSKSDIQTAFTDMLLAPADAAGMPTVLESGADAASGDLFGDSFATDSSHALYFTNVDPDILFGDFSARKVGGGMPTLLGTKVWIGYAALGAKVVFNDNWAPLGNTSGIADLRVVDLASGGAPTLIASRAAADILVSVDKKKVFFAWAADPMREGLYVATLP